MRYESASISVLETVFEDWSRYAMEGVMPWNASVSSSSNVMNIRSLDCILNE